MKIIIITLIINFFSFFTHSFAQVPGLLVEGTGFGAQQRITDITSGNSLVLQSGAGSNLKITGYNYLNSTAQPLYLSTDGANTILNPNGGRLGLGTETPSGSFLLDAAGPVRSFGNSSHFVAQTTGGTNSWARYYMRSNVQSWFMGTSQGFNGNQLYISDETNNQTRLSIQPAGGPIALTGNMTQDEAGFGLPKAMVYINSNGTIGRCYNGVTGATTGGCGYSSVRVNEGNYQVNFNFDIRARFFAISTEQSCCTGIVSESFAVFGESTLNVGILSELAFFNDAKPESVDRPFMIIIY